MLHLILGRAGSGKTTWARRFLAEAAGAGTTEGHPRAILIVPEQYSFESERAILRGMGAEKAQGILVTSFTRLAELSFRTYGGIAGRRLTDGGRRILMRLAIDSVEDALCLYKENVRTGALVQVMLSAEAEMKMCAISPEVLAQAALQAGNEVLRQKTKDLSLIFSAYEALVQQSYLDPQDDLTRMQRHLSEHPFFVGCKVVIDSFSGFTMQECGVLRYLFQQADDVYITLCTDGLADPEEGTGLFSAVRKTAGKLIRLARENGAAVAQPVLLPSGKRFRSPDLAHLESVLFRGEMTAPEQAAEHIAVYRGENVYDEAEYVATEIRSLVMEKGYRYRDIAVIARTPEAYRGCLDVAMEKRGIPYFMDQPKAIDAEPLIHFVLSAFRVVTGGFASEAVFSYLKTGLAGLDSYAISLLENYTYIWNLNGKKWISEWTANPDGFGGEMTPQAETRLQEINAFREQAVRPLVQFEKAVADADGEQMARAVYDLLLHAGADKALPLLSARLEAAGRQEQAKDQYRLWELLMNVLDQTALVLKGTYPGAAKYADLLRMVIEAEDVSEIPQGQDEVTVGAADRMRPAGPKVVFLIGAVRGLFPLTPSASGVFSDGERRELISLGLPLGRTLEEASVEERFAAYGAAASASERLYLSWAPNGEGACYPSELVTGVKNAFLSVPEYDRYRLPQDFFADAEETAFAMAARHWEDPSAVGAALRVFFEGREGYEGRVAALSRVMTAGKVRLQEPENARALFRNGQGLSATQIETYHLCRFRYFCRFGMGIQERRQAQIGALEYGSLMHFLLERLFADHGSEAILQMTDSVLHETVAGLIREYTRLNFGGDANKTPRFLAQLHRLAGSACVLLRHVAEELSQSDFVPAYFELDVGKQTAPYRIPLPDGSAVTVVGKIDRVDIMDRDGKRYVRVVDYKTGKKEFRLSDVLYGLNLQMLIYLAALIESGGAQPAGVLYMPSVRPRVSVRRDAEASEIREAVDKELRMNGVVLGEEAVIRGMEHEAAGRYIPVSLKNGKLSGGESILSREEFECVIGAIREKIIAMAETLFSGDISPEPLLTGRRGCDYCPYFAVCGREYGDEDVEKETLKRTEVLKKLREEANPDERTEMDARATGCD